MSSVVQSGIQSSCEDSMSAKTLLLQSNSYVAESPLRSWCRNCCKPRCIIRRFASKSALLVIVWNFLINVSFSSIGIVGGEIAPNENAIIDTVPTVVWTLSAVAFGWLADRRLGHYRVAKIGMLVLFACSVFQSALFVANSAVHLSYDLSVGLVTVSSSVGTCGTAILLVTLPQVGLDQMPASSASNITSFIAWFVVSFFGGSWVSEMSFGVGASCIGDEFSIIWSLFPVVCMGMVLISDSFLTPKWLIIEPKSPQSLRTIYHVVKFAAKHKAPLNRSAFTYWEEDIPSRIDLGKSKYGGPFTTEQVEDVKTLLKILSLTLPMWLTMTSFFMYNNVLLLFNGNLSSINGTLISEASCTSGLLTSFTLQWEMWCPLIVIVYELTIYPVIGHMTPTSIRRIGAAAFFVVIVNVLVLILSIVYASEGTLPSAVTYIHSFVVAVLLLILLTSSMEFVCAQSPYNMRGLLLGYVWCISTFCFVVSMVIWIGFLKMSYFLSPVIYSTIASLLGLVGFVFYCVLARWYKRRVRDDIPTPQVWVEEAYDRYLGQNVKKN